MHGTTIATNALLERSGARVGLITTAGFGDLLEIRRGGRPDSFDLGWRRPEHLVRPRLVREVAGRIGPGGEVRQPLDEDQLAIAVHELRQAGVEAIAVSLLFSFANPEHELRAAELIRTLAPELAVSLSFDVFPQIREYERASTVVIDAYLKPPVDRYARELEQLALERGLGEVLVMRSNGGAITPEGARGLPVSMVRSGPAGGVTAAVFIADATGHENVMLADMGGTSFDVCVIAEGRPALTTEAELEWGIPYCQPMVDVRSIGAGGGSIAWLDSAGILHVGPQSAGAVPGPACYASGGDLPTVTDANLILGRLSADLSLAGDVELDLEQATRAVARIADPMGLGVNDAAHGILEIADHNMGQELRLISIDRGLDPRDFALMAFGGAGPLHAASLARALRMRTVIVPIFPGAFSAFGALIADSRFDYLRTAMIRGLDDVTTFVGLFDELEGRARADLTAQGHTGAEPRFDRRLDLRYRGQAWELEIAVEGEIDAASLDSAAARFHVEHEARFGWSLEEMQLECVNLKLAATIERPRPELPILAGGPVPDPVHRRPVRFERGDAPLTVPVYWRDELRAGNAIEGPAVIAEAISTTLLPPGDLLRCDQFGNLIVDIHG